MEYFKNQKILLDLTEKVIELGYLKIMVEIMNYPNHSGGKVLFPLFRGKMKFISGSL